MARLARTLTDADGPLTGFAHRIVDRDPLYSAQFRSLLAPAGVRLLRLPANRPNLNAYAERSASAETGTACPLRRGPSRLCAASIGATVREERVPSMSCPDDTQVAIFVRGELPLEDVSRFEAHLDECGRCLAFIGDAAQGARSSRLPDTEPGAEEESVFIHLLAAAVRRSDRAEQAVGGAQREQFGPYRVTGVLGKGAMGVVYRAVDDRTGRAAAIKTVRHPNPKLLAAIRREIAFLERQRHPGVVPVFESGLIDGDPWYAMELLEGGTLDAFNRLSWTEPSRWAVFDPRASRPPCSESPPAAGGRLNEVIELFARVCDPLDFIHQQGIVHCDLKPANIFVRDGGQPVLMDFGLLSRAQGTIGRESLEVGGYLRGTLPYLAPELIRGQIPDGRADLYAFGCILYESVTGRPPFVANTLNGYLDAHLREEPLPASSRVKGIPAALDDVLRALLAKRPADRIGSANVIADRLKGACPSIDGTPASPRSTIPYLFRPRMVGRDRVIDQILACRPAVAGGHGRFVLVGGESGIGKTFLASEIAGRVAQGGFDVITGECTPAAPGESGDSEVIGVALGPFRKLIENAADRCRDAPPGAALGLFGSERTIALLSRYEPSLAHLRDAAEDEGVGPLPPTAERERVIRALSEVVERLAADNPLLLVVDDLQWADDLSLAFLDHLASWDWTGKRLLVLGLYRSEETSKAIAELEAKPAVQSIRLERLDASALKVLVGDLLAECPSDAFIEALATHSEGNPFFVAEYLRAGVAEGVLRRSAQGWTLDGAGDAAGYGGLALPASLKALLERRLNALTPGGQRVVESAAVLGREFPTAMLPTVAGLDAEAVARVVDEMVERQVVRKTSGDRLRFLHDKMREAAYARLEVPRRAGLHSAAATVIEETYRTGADLPMHYAELAYHWRRAGEPGRAVDYFEKAGDHALRSSANADAVRLFEEANRLAAGELLSIPRTRRASWARMTGDALHGLGDLEASKRHLLSATDLLARPMPPSPLRQAWAIGRGVLRQILHRVVPRR